MSNNETKFTTEYGRKRHEEKATWMLLTQPRRMLNAIAALQSSVSNWPLVAQMNANIMQQIDSLPI